MRLLTLALIALALRAQTPLTTVTGTLYDGGGQKVTGNCTYVLRSGLALGANAGQIVGEPVHVSVVNGAFSAQIVPTDTMTPSGQYYAVTCSGTRGWTKSGNWLVPSSGTPVKLETVWTATAPTPGILIPLSQLAQTGAASNQAMCWTGSAWAPGSCGGTGGSGGLGRYALALSGTSVTVLASVHGLGTSPAIATCRDGSGVVFDPGSEAINGLGDVTITSTSPMTGACILQGTASGSGQYAANLSGTSVTVLASIHGLGVNVTVPTCYDGSNLRFEPGSISINGSGDVTVASPNTMSGKCILQ